MKSLRVLERLAEQAVDRERQALLAIDGKIAEVEGQILALRQAIGREAAARLDFMTSGATLSAYIEASTKRLEQLNGVLEQLRDARQAQLERVLAERIEQKRYERLAERRASQAVLEAAAKDQKAIDELVTISRRQD
ncbi:MAG: flagellar FliJ family protein [Pseudomonadota bacterium]